MNYQKLGIALAMAVTDAETLDEEGGRIQRFYPHDSCPWY